VHQKYCVNRNLPHPCKCEIGKLLSCIGNCLRKLNIFDTDNIFVCYIDININIEEGNNCSIKTYSYAIHRNPSSVDKKGIYVVVGNFWILGCDNRSNIIYIGGQREGEQSLYGRIKKFIKAIENGDKKLHSGGAKIHKRLCELGQIQETCLYLIGFPINDNYKVEKAEGCFQVIYAYYYNRSPCFVDEMPAADFDIFRSIPPNDAKRTIQFILTTIDIFFRDCIQKC